MEMHLMKGEVPLDTFDGVKEAADDGKACLPESNFVRHFLVLLNIYQINNSRISFDGSAYIFY